MRTSRSAPFATAATSRWSKRAGRRCSSASPGSPNGAPSRGHAVRWRAAAARVARALMAAPRLLVLDEPSAGLGPQAIALVAAAVKGLDAAVLLADRQLALARAAADRIVLPR